MTTDEPAPPPDEPPERVRVTAAPAASRPHIAPVVYVAGGAVLLLALVFLWRYPLAPRRAADDRAAALQVQVETLADRVGKLEARTVPDLGPLDTRLSRLEARPPVDLAPLEARLARLEGRTGPDLSPLQARIAALEARTGPDLGPLQARIAQLENRPPPPPVDLSGINNRLDTLARDAGKQSGDAAALGQRLDALANDLGAKVTTLQRDGQAVAALAGRARRTAAVQAATAALDSGRPLGAIPDAPPALARYATAAPPTASSLRLSFPAAAEAAHDASQPAVTGSQGFFGRAWTTAQQVVTVRQGDQVLLGDPVAGVLAHAGELVDAGDIAGALGLLQQLPEPAKAAVAGWTGQAQGLLDARAALASMAAQNG